MSDAARNVPRELPMARWVEPVTALLMALSTLATAWCSYQSAAFTRAANRHVNEYNSLERRASVLTLQGMQSATIHTGMFMQVLAAKQAGDDKLVAFLVERFPPDLRKAYDAWLAQKPLENPGAAPHPFVPELYELRGDLEAKELRAKADASLQESRVAGTASGQYLAKTVLFATVLFFASASGKFEQRRVRIVAFTLAAMLFVFAVLQVLLLPR
ncbi:MAG: hypothetical protein ACO1QR_07920 [Chthoniobacteraceae bacterium]